jgi:hypothetical protein
MTFKPTPHQLETIADYCAANMPVEATAAALDTHPDTLRAWIGKLAATRSASRYMPPPPAPRVPPPAPPMPAPRPGRVLCDRVFEARELPADSCEGF